MIFWWAEGSRTEEVPAPSINAPSEDFFFFKGGVGAAVVASLDFFPRNTLRILLRELRLSFFLLLTAVEAVAAVSLSADIVDSLSDRWTASICLSSSLRCLVSASFSTGNRSLAPEGDNRFCLWCCLGGRSGSGGGFW